MGGRRAGLRWRALAVLGSVLATWSFGIPAEASRNRELTVMTQNLYLGSSLDAALRAETEIGFVLAVAEIYATAVSTDFPARAEELADEIAVQQPDIIGLQEVSTWATTPLVQGGPPSYDFLDILEDELAERGLSYEVVAESQNAAIGPVPLIAPAYGCGVSRQCDVSLSDRDVILVNTATPALHWQGGTSGRYIAQARVRVPTGDVLSFDRGWASVEISYRGRDFRFVNTHLEVADFPFSLVQVEQARELLVGPLAGAENVVLVGDFNSAADGSGTATYGILAGAGLVDAWTLPDPGYTCCQDEALDNPASNLAKRFDVIFTRGLLTSSDPTLLLGEMEPPPPLWASDHAGVVADILILV
jgi:endonuclease/exonuclease/phosphatase family metal-dependent hydrolase